MVLIYHFFYCCFSLSTWFGLIPHSYGQRRANIIDNGKDFEKFGKLIQLTSTSINWGELHLKNESPSTDIVDDLKQRQIAFQGQYFKLNSSNNGNSTESVDQEHNDEEEDDYVDLNTFDVVTPHKHLIDDLLDPDFYEKTVHPKRDFLLPTRINLSMSLYQILEVNEHLQSVVVNVWMVQDWYDEFVDWNPHEYGMINTTIVPYNEIFIPDTYLYNSESLEQKRTEAMMNAILTTGYWRNDSRGAAVQLMFPAIYKLSCHLNVKNFPYDQQNCSFIISSWTRDKGSLDYWPKVDSVNLKNFAKNEEWEIISFKFERLEQNYKCCPHPWVMLYAHLVIKRRPLYYIINLVIPTSIITVVAVTGFFTPSSSSSERDEKLYLGINTLLTLLIMMLMIVSSMPSTSNYVPLMGWYYMGIIGAIVFGTLLATMVLFIHGRKNHLQPIPSFIRRLIYNPVVSTLLFEPPMALIDIWTEYGFISELRLPSEDIEHKVIHEINKSAALFPALSAQLSNTSNYNYERKLHSLTKQYDQRMRVRQRQLRQRRETIVSAAEFLTTGSQNNARAAKRHKLIRRCALEWEFLANVIDRVLLFIFCFITFLFFSLLAFYDRLFDVSLSSN